MGSQYYYLSFARDCSSYDSTKIKHAKVREVRREPAAYRPHFNPLVSAAKSRCT
jgi:hypothetical protein